MGDDRPGFDEILSPPPRPGVRKRSEVNKNLDRSEEQDSFDKNEFMSLVEDDAVEAISRLSRAFRGDMNKVSQWEMSSTENATIVNKLLELIADDEFCDLHESLFEDETLALLVILAPEKIEDLLVETKSNEFKLSKIVSASCRFHLKIPPDKVAQLISHCDQSGYGIFVTKCAIELLSGQESPDHLSQLKKYVDGDERELVVTAGQAACYVHGIHKFSSFPGNNLYKDLMRELRCAVLDEGYLIRFFSNPDRSLESTVESLQKVNLEDYANALILAAKSFDGGRPPEDVQERVEQMRKSYDGEDNQFAEAVAALDEAKKNKDRWLTIYRYLFEHAAEIAGLGNTDS